MPTYSIDFRRGSRPGQTWNHAIVTCPSGEYANLRGGACIEIRQWGINPVAGSARHFGHDTHHTVGKAYRAYREKLDAGYTFGEPLVVQKSTAAEVIVSIRKMMGSKAGDAAFWALADLVQIERNFTAPTTGSAVDEALASLPDSLSLAVVY